MGSVTAHGVYTRTAESADSIDPGRAPISVLDLDVD